MRIGSAFFLGLLLAAGCGGDDSGPPKDEPVSRGDASANRHACIDKDHDGFGTDCDMGDDCDDADAKITDECVRCVKPNLDCPCEPGTEPMICTPKDKIIVRDGMTYKVTCTEGRRYCRDAFYTDCEFLEQYTTMVVLK